jgi:putative permease
MKYLREWFHRNFSDPQAVALVIVLVVGFSIVLFMGKMLAPVLASIVLAYLLEGVVKKLANKYAARFKVVIIVFSAFMAFVAYLLLGVSPLLWTQLTELIQDLPKYIAKGQLVLMAIPEHYPVISAEQIKAVTDIVQRELATSGQQLLSISLSSIPGIITVLVYFVLVPLLVFFFLKDKDLIIKWSTGFLPQERSLSSKVWSEVDQQIGNYVRGKFWEILIVGITSFVVFAFLGLKYAILLGVLVGLSVLVPYIGAAVVTLPVALVAYFQWGWSSEFAYLMVAYTIIQALDGNVLVPLLFSEVVNLHPVAIIVAILVFGGLWGFWGVFFAIPLATLVSAIISAWPTNQQQTVENAAE